MLKFIDVNEEQLNKMTRFVIEQKTNESTVHPFLEDGNRKILKLFTNAFDIDNKIKKILLMNQRLTDNNNVVIAESIIKYNGKIIGYTMPEIKGNLFDKLIMSKKDKILFLKEVNEILKKLHDLNIVCGDFHRNIIIGEDDNIYFIDYDNFAIDDLKVDCKNVYIQNYEKKISTFDKNFDNYLMNLYTIATILKVHTSYIYYYHNINPKDFILRDKDINEIIKNTFSLNEIYTEDLIIDKINSNEDFKKIKRKIF